MALGQIQRRYSRFILDAFSYCRNSKNGAHIQQSVISRTHLPTSSCKPSTMKSAAFQKRFYFKNREYKFKNEGWFENPKRVDLAIILFSLGAVAAVSSGKWVTVPYTERNHFIFFGKFLTKMLPNESIVEETVLPRFDPDSILGRQIFQDIIDQALPLEMEIRRAENQETENKGIMIISLGGSMDDYEEEPKCEIVVVDSPKVRAASFGRFGKIYVTNELLQYYTDYDEMIATIFGRVVGHDLARHTEEKLSKLICTASVIGTSLYLFWQSTFIRSIMPRYILVKLLRRRFLPSLSFVVTVALLSYLPMMKYNREIEMEADHIGLMLASTAGYNPIVGLMFPVHRVTLQTSSRWLPDCFYPSPSRGTRSLRLARPQVLTEAMYRNPRAKN